MTSASSLAFPGSRTLAGWWRQLLPHHPAAIAVGHLFFHRLEASVAVSRLKSLDRFSRLLLEALELELARAATNKELLTRLQARSHLEPAILHQILRRLQVEGLVDMSDRWVPTPLGRHGLQHGHYPRETTERRVFHFLERCDAVGQRTGPPHFLNLRGIHAAPWHANAAHAFDAAWLRQCLDQPEEWKQTRGFPVDVVRVLEQPAPGEDASAWQRVLVDHPGQALAVLVLAGDADSPRVLGFAARQEGWQLHMTEPLLVLERGWEELFPELIGPALDVLDRAWRGWAQAHGIPETEMRVLGLAGHRLQMQAPASAVARLRAIKGDTWLLLGAGHLRPALQLEFVGA